MKRPTLPVLLGSALPGSALPGSARLGSALLGATLLVSGCTVGPDYQEPVPPAMETLEEAFVHAAPAGETATSSLLETEPEAAWWRLLDDPVLDELIERARLANHDLRSAEANLRAAAALLGLARQDFLPTGGASASIERRETSLASFGSSFDVPDFDSTDTSYSVGFAATWEIDLFGRIRRAVEAREANFQATEAERRATFVAVVAEVAETYATLRGAQRRLAVARANADAQGESLELVDALLDAGRGTSLDSARARAQLESTRATVPLLEVDEARALHRLAVLVGEAPTALAAELAADPRAQPRSTREPSDRGVGLPSVPERLAIGDPAGLLRRRPDIAAAERSLAAATAEIGVATADLYPRIGLSASAGFLALSLDDLGSEDSRVSTLGPFLDWPLLDRGRIRDRIANREAEADALLVRWEQTVLLALEETETALVRLDRARRRQALLERAEEAATEATELADLRFERGLDAYLTVLDAETRRLEIQDALAQAATETTRAFIALYEALGGGWNTAP